jgi:hypothetical protein
LQFSPCSFSDSGKRYLEKVGSGMIHAGTWVFSIRIAKHPDRLVGQQATDGSLSGDDGA